jgi:hypothetical protein
MPKRTMKRKLYLFCAAIAGSAILAGCVSMPIPAPVTVSEIVQWSRENVPADVIIQRMRDSRTVYRLKASQLVTLSDEGVSPKVLDYMQSTYLAAVRQNQALEDWSYWWPGWDGFWYGGPAFGWPNWGWGVGFGGEDFFRQPHHERRP